MDRYRMLPSYHYKNNEDGLLTESVGKPLRDYKIYGNLAYDGLPIEYQRVEYIESTGTQYIKTGVTPQYTFPGFDATFLTKNALSTSGFGAIFGVRTASKYVEFQLSTYSSGTSGILRYSDKEYDAGLVAGEKTHVTLKNRVYTDSYGVSTSITSSLNAPEYQITLFALNERNNIIQHGKVQLYSLKLYSGDIVIRDFIPCYRKSDGEIGLYDIVRQHFYTNDGTGTFLKGKDIYQSPDAEDLQIPDEYQQVNYIKSTGTQYINTGYTPKQGDSITIENARCEISNVQQALFSAGDKDPRLILLINLSGQYGAAYYKYFASGAAPTVSGTLDNTTRIAIKEDGSLYYNDSLVATSPPVGDVDTPLYLLRRANEDTGYASATLGRFTIKNNNETKLDLIPCSRKSDGEVGMYDVVSGVFYGNDGTGAFLKGKDIYQSPDAEDLLVPSEYQQVDYVETTGEQYINVNYIPKGKLTVEGKVYISQLTKEMAIMGAESFGWEFGLIPENKMFSYLRSSSSISITPTASLCDVPLEFTAVNDYDGGYRSLSLNLEDSFIDSNNVDSSYKQNLLLFDYRKTYPFVGKCYGIKIYDNDILVRNFVPCYRKSDEEIGMYDIVKGVFYTNQGTSPFLKGEDITYTALTHTSVGDYVGNIFDYDTVTKNPQAEKVTIDGEKCYKSQSLTANLWAVFRTNMSGMQDGKKYTISFDIWADIETGFINNYVFINNATIPRHTLTKITIERQNITTTFTYRANTGAEWLHLYFEYIPENIMYISNVSIIPCEPYKIPITLRSKNISPFNQPTAVIANITTTITSDTIELDGDGTRDYRCVTTGKLSPGTYTLCVSQLSGADSMEDTYEAFYIWKKNTWIGLAMCNVANTGQKWTTFDISEDTDVWFGIYVRAAQNLHNYKAKYQIIKGCIFDYDYEPNRGSVTENIYLSKPLSRCGVYGVDYIDFKAQKVVWNTGEYTLTGEEEWQNLYGESLFGCYNLIDNANWQPMLSTHYIYNSIQSGLNAGMANNEFAYQTADKNLYFKDTRFTTVDEWKEWLSRQYESGHPVIVRYTLATPVEEPITLPKPLTNIETCVIDIDTQVPPSKTQYQYYKGGK